MAVIGVAIDNIHGKGSDRRTLDEFIAVLKQAGHTVQDRGVGPNGIQRASQGGNVDVMVQIAGGICIGTASDFIYGIYKTYYHAKKMCLVFMSCAVDPETYKFKGLAWDDNFSKGEQRRLALSYTGKCYKDFASDTHNILGFDNTQYVIYPPGRYKTGTDAGKAFLQAMNGGTVNTSGGEQKSSSSSIFDKIKEVCLEWNKNGIDMSLNGDVLSIKRSTTKDAKQLDTSLIQVDSVSIEEYDKDTPNKVEMETTVQVKDKNGKPVKDKKGKIKTKKIKLKLQNKELIKKFGENKETITEDVAPKKEEKKEDEKDKDKKEKEQEVKILPPEIQIRDKYQILKRKHNHSIDLKCLVRRAFGLNKWVQLSIPLLNINDYYYITKRTFDEDIFETITLEPSCPDRKVELQKSTGENVTNAGKVCNGRICSIISKVGGVPITDPHSLYENFRKMHYEYYYNFRYGFETSLQRIQSGGGLNCVEHAVLFYKAYKEAGFTNPIRYCNGTAHCRSGRSYGHVWVQVQEKGNWTNVDPSGAASVNHTQWGTAICFASCSASQYDPSFLTSR